MKKFLLVLALAALACAKDYETIDSVDTSFRLFGKDDRIEIIAVKDPKVQGVTCYQRDHRRRGGSLRSFRFMRADRAKNFNQRKAQKRGYF